MTDRGLFDTILKPFIKCLVFCSSCRFVVFSEVDLKATLSRLGIQTLFSRSANLSSMSSAPLYVTSMKQAGYAKSMNRAPRLAWLLVSTIRLLWNQMAKELRTFSLSFDSCRFRNHLFTVSRICVVARHQRKQPISPAQYDKFFPYFFLFCSSNL